MILHITDFKHLRNYQLWLKFNNGSEGVVDLTQELWGSMFEPLKDLALFSQVRLDKELDTVDKSLRQLLKMLAQSQQAVSLGKIISSVDAFSRLREQRGLT